MRCGASIGLASGLLAAFVAQTEAQERSAPQGRSHVIERPGGEANRSRFEYVPENQPSARYVAPKTGDDQIFETELEMLRQRVRELELEVDELRAHNARLTRAAETRGR